MPVVVFTDANAMIEPGGLASLVRWLEEPTVGAVAGEKRVITARGESVYWAFEAWLKRLENRTGATIGLCGELAALRRSDYVDLPSDVAVDDLWLALDVVEQHKRVVYEPAARVSEDASASAGLEWGRRTRIICGALDVLWRRRRHLVPGRSPVAGQLWGHRLVRSLLGPVAHAGLVLGAVGSARRSRVARLFLAVHAVGLVAVWREERSAKVTPAERLLAQVLFLQAVGLAGVVRWLRRDRPVFWQKEERVPGSGRGV
jgi:hypothetical protein